MYIHMNLIQSSLPKLKKFNWIFYLCIYRFKICMCLYISSYLNLFFFFVWINSSFVFSPQHQDSFAKNCDICNAKTTRVQGANISASHQTKHSTKIVAALQVNGNSVLTSNNSTLNQNTLTSSNSSASVAKHNCVTRQTVKRYVNEPPNAPQLDICGTRWAIGDDLFWIIDFRKGDLTSASQSNHQHSRERKTGTVCAPVATQLVNKTIPNAIRSSATQLNQQKVYNIYTYIFLETIWMYSYERNSIHNMAKCISDVLGF